MAKSHVSMKVNGTTVDALVDQLCATPGVHGARMTGGGFGGCVVALAEPGALDRRRWPDRAWPVRASGGAYLVTAGAPVA